MDLDAKIEALLFYKAEPLSVKKLAELLDETEDQVLEVLSILSQKLTGRGLVLVQKEDSYLLGTVPEAAQIIEKIARDELSTDLGRAGLETLTIIAYEGPISRTEIDYIRGVNSSFILRHLTIRGLVERVPDKNDSRRFLYKPTFELLQYLGVKDISELPDFESIRGKIEKFKQEQKENNQESNDDGNAN